MLLSVDELIARVKESLEREFPGARISDIQIEGPIVVIYTDSRESLVELEGAVRKLAKEFKKRLDVRPSPRIREKEEIAEKKIRELVPKEAGVRSVVFDHESGIAYVEAEKPGLVVGKQGILIRELSSLIGWKIRTMRAPPKKSEIVEGIRKMLFSASEERRKFLLDLGTRIHRPLTSKPNWIRVVAVGGFREVGRTAVLVQTKDTRILLDCGLSMSGQNGLPHLELPDVNPEILDAVVISHAHLDHCGALPYLVRFGYDGPIYCTPPTRDLMALLISDYLEVSEKEGVKAPYRKEDLIKALKRTIVLDYGETTDIAPEVRLTFHNAGHILGSAVTHIHIGEGLHNIVFTGDFKYEKTRLFDQAKNIFPRVETLIMESTYGGPNDYQPSRKEAEEALIRNIKETVLEKRGKVLIPVFAVGRSQEIMVVLEEAIRTGKLPEIPVYVDGLILEATAIHTAYPEYLVKDLKDRIFHKDDNPFLSPVFVEVGSPDERKEAVEGEPCVILSTSGMMNGGPVLDYFKYLAEDERNKLIFVGYQAEGTLGRAIQRGRREIPMQEEGKQRIIEVKMDVVTVDGFSGHSDRRQLIKYVARMNPRPRKVLTMHGEEAKCLKLAGAIKSKLGIEAEALENLEADRVWWRR